MSQHPQQPKQIVMSTQAFLILCRLFDSCYDQWKENEDLEWLVESIAGSLLPVVSGLQELKAPPARVSIQLTMPQMYFLQKHVDAIYRQMQQNTDQPAGSRELLEECLRVLTPVEV
ncbi:hypothetical protein LOK74_07440 [Brevibacillus humidisoli]|uniref:hypothetical protein n=1 Tax=Brevibacillus humidisoli TaxID=2895522 RepID=UPI001E579927|nr:hypothetical protein [Brevibacillus humidisoli]UFJ42314.1 hypothetical protein LOK74_07440 [Brevibacillus humidisoli]